MDRAVISGLQSLRGLSATARACRFCGADTVSGAGASFCVSCELQQGSGAGSGTEDASAGMNAIYRDAVLGKTAGLDSFAREKRQQELQPEILYGIGVLYSHASSHTYRDRNYSRSGFMEENSGNVYASLDLASRSKEFLFKALYSAEHGEGSEGDRLYMRFIANVRLGRLTYAGRILEALPASAIDARRYAGMVYSVETRSGDSRKRILEAMRSGEPNAYYYLARRLAQLKRFNDAIYILKQLTGALNMPMAGYLLGDLRGFVEKTGM